MILLTAPLEKSDQQFVEQLYHKYIKLMFSVAYKYVALPEQAQDVVQQAWINILDNLDRIQSIEDKARAAYLAMTVRNCAMDSFRKDKAKGFDD